MRSTSLIDPNSNLVVCLHIAAAGNGVQQIDRSVIKDANTNCAVIGVSTPQWTPLAARDHRPPAGLPRSPSALISFHRHCLSGSFRLWNPSIRWLKPQTHSHLVTYASNLQDWIASPYGKQLSFIISPPLWSSSIISTLYKLTLPHKSQVSHISLSNVHTINSFFCVYFLLRYFSNN